MTTRRTRPALTIRAILVAALSEGNTVRMFVPEHARPRVIDGVPKSILEGRDGRERVVIAVEASSEHVEIRLLVDRIARVEWLDTNGATNEERSAGEVPEPSPVETRPRPVDPTHSGRRGRGTTARNLEPTHSGRQTAKPGRPRQPETARSGRAPAKPTEHPTEPEMPVVPASVAAGRARPATAAPDTRPEIRKPTPR